MRKKVLVNCLRRLAEPPIEKGGWEYMPERVDMTHDRAYAQHDSYASPAVSA